MATPVSGIGTIFRQLIGSVYTPIARVMSISGPSMSREMIDITTFDSTDGYREFIPSLRDGGEVSFDMLFTRPGYDALLADFESDTAGSYQIIFPDDEKTSVSFSGYVTAVPFEDTMDDAIKCSCTIKVSGPVTTDSGSSV